MSDSYKPLITRRQFEKLVDANMVTRDDEVRFIIHDETLVKNWKNEKIAQEVQDRLNKKFRKT